MNIAFATTCTDDYTEYLRVFLYSILRNNPNFDLPFFVFTNKEELNKKNMKILMNTYSKVIFHEVDHKFYITHNKDNVKYYSIECFTLNYDKVVYFGCDVLCLNSIEPLYDLCATITDIGMAKERRRPCFNNNCMIIDKKYINPETYYALLDADYSKRETFGTDQKLFNCFFEGRIKEIPHRYNVLVTETDVADGIDILFLHYIHKPLHFRGRTFLSVKHINLWESYRNGN